MSPRKIIIIRPDPPSRFVTDDEFKVLQKALRRFDEESFTNSALVLGIEPAKSFPGWVWEVIDQPFVIEVQRAHV